VGPEIPSVASLVGGVEEPLAQKRKPQKQAEKAQGRCVLMALPTAHCPLAVPLSLPRPSTQTCRVLALPPTSGTRAAPGATPPYHLSPCTACPGELVLAIPPTGHREHPLRYNPGHMSAKNQRAGDTLRATHVHTHNLGLGDTPYTQVHTDEIQTHKSTQGKTRRHGHTTVRYGKHMHTQPRAQRKHTRTHMCTPPRICRNATLRNRHTGTRRRRRSPVRERL
jgi:hypothetical protein